MLYIDSIWEYIFNFLELALFIIFIHKKLRIRANYKHQAVLMFLFVSFQFAVLCTLNKMGISSYSTLMSSCVLDIGYAVLFYRDSIIRRIFCPDNSIVLLRLLLNCVWQGSGSKSSY